MIKTKITEMLGVKYPIVGGCMMWITTPEFVASISNAGGLGILASVIYKSKEEFAEAIDRVNELTDKPYAVNINLFPALAPVDNKEYVEVLVDKGVKIVETSGHSAPADLCGRFKEAGMTWIHKCVGVRYALKVQEMGADIITVVGYENGGATGRLDIGTLVLVPRVVEAVDLPEVAWTWLVAEATAEVAEVAVRVVGPLRRVTVAWRAARSRLKPGVGVVVIGPEARDAKVLVVPQEIGHPVPRGGRRPPAAALPLPG
ncbi:MAG: NAD(P)H-dependent flavin oxidoreductase, partial [Thermodesulfobacteriota bacterium]